MSQTSADLEHFKRLGRAYLHANRLEEALAAFSDALHIAPQDVEALVWLGDCYLGAGDAATAVNLYRHASQLAPQDNLPRQRLSLASNELGLTQPNPEPIPTDPQAIARLLQRLTGRVAPVTEAEVAAAARVLGQIIHSPKPASMIAAHLDDLNALAPALLELNIRQARADGRLDLVKALELLLDNLCLQMDLPSAEPAAKPAPQPAAPRPVRLLFLGPLDWEATIRQTLPAEALRQLNCEVDQAESFACEQLGRYDVVIARQAHANPELSHGLQALAAGGARIVLDLPADLEHMPATHRDYRRLGLNSPNRAQAYKRALRAAHLITTPSAVLAEDLRHMGYLARLMPSGWSRADHQPEASGSSQPVIHIGWVTASGQLDDLAEIRRPLVRLAREFPNVRLVLAADSEAGALLTEVPEQQLIWRPASGQLDQWLSQLDILLVPRRDTAYNRSLDDFWLLAAGVRRLAWVASPTSAHKAWGVGGLLAANREEWFGHLQRLAADGNLRAALGQAGRRQAEEREIGRLADRWLEVINETRQTPRLETQAAVRSDPPAPVERSRRAPDATRVPGAPAFLRPR